MCFPPPPPPKTPYNRIHISHTSIVNSGISFAPGVERGKFMSFFSFLPLSFLSDSQSQSSETTCAGPEEARKRKSQGTNNERQRICANILSFSLPPLFKLFLDLDAPHDPWMQKTYYSYIDIEIELYHWSKGPIQRLWRSRGGLDKFIFLQLQASRPWLGLVLSICRKFDLVL